MFTLGRYPNAGLRQYSLAGGKLTYVNTASKKQANFTSRAGEQSLILCVLHALARICRTLGD